MVLHNLQLVVHVVVDRAQFRDFNVDDVRVRTLRVSRDSGSFLASLYFLFLPWIDGMSELGIITDLDPGTRLLQITVTFIQIRVLVES